MDSHDSLPFLASTEANPDLTSALYTANVVNIFNPIYKDEYIEYESPWDAFSPNFLSSIARGAIFKLLFSILRQEIRISMFNANSSSIQVTRVRYHSIESLDTLYISRVVVEE